MASFTTQVGYLAGDTTGYTSEITQWLDDGVKEIVDMVSSVSTENAKLFAIKSASFTAGAPKALGDNARVVAVESVYLGVTRLAREVTREQGYLASDSNSIHYRDESDPGYYILDNEIKLVGGGTTNYAYIVDYGAVTDSATPSVANFPESLYPQLVRYAAIKLLHAKIESLTETDEDVELAASMMATRKELEREYAQAFSKWGVSV